MKLFVMEGACLARGKETSACISLGFRYQNKHTNISSRKGGATL